MKLGQQLLDSQTECLKLFFFHPQRCRAPILALDQQAKRAVARLTNRLGLQPRGRPEDVLGVKHSRLAYRRQPFAYQGNMCG